MRTLNRHLAAGDRDTVCTGQVLVQLDVELCETQRNAAPESEVRRNEGGDKEEVQAGAGEAVETRWGELIPRTTLATTTQHAGGH